MATQKGKSASQLVAELAADPVFMEDRAKRQRLQQERTQAFRLAERPLVEELNAHGANIDSVADLVRTTSSYPTLLPILLAHLGRPYPPQVREGIARALAVPESRAIWNELVRRFEAEPEDPQSQVKWALHLALAAAADSSVLSSLIELAIDRRHGRNRAMFAHSLAKIRDERARATLLELRDDPDIAEDVKKVLRSK